MSKLHSIVDLYMHCAGESEIPREWHHWCCLSLIAAHVEDRVYYKKFEWESLSPNMYTFLVGPSGSGKGGAINFAMQFVKNESELNIHYGASTKQGLMDKLGKNKSNSHRLYVVQAELADAISTGHLADAFIKSMTDWYNPSNMDFQESTRLHGSRTFKPPCLNWLAGTTTEWLIESVGAKAMASGFVGRVVIAPGTYSYNKRVYDPKLYQAPDYHAVIEVIKERLAALTSIEGEFSMTDSAYELDRHWYETRKPPREEMAPFWQREHDLTLKLAMVLSLSQSLNLIIKREHIQTAQNLVKMARDMLPSIMEAVNRNKNTELIEPIMQYLRTRKKWTGRADIYKSIRLIDRGRTPLEADQLLQGLVASEELEKRRKGRGVSYRIAQKKRAFLFNNVEIGEDEDEQH